MTWRRRWHPRGVCSAQTGTRHKLVECFWVSLSGSSLIFGSLDRTVPMGPRARNNRISTSPHSVCKGNSTIKVEILCFHCYFVTQMLVLAGRCLPLRCAVWFATDLLTCDDATHRWFDIALQRKLIGAQSLMTSLQIPWAVVR